MAGETNIRIFLLAARSKMVAAGLSLVRLADTTTLVSITTLIICPGAYGSFLPAAGGQPQLPD